MSAFEEDKPDRARRDPNAHDWTRFWTNEWR
jgi:hypothetical protein